MKNIKAIIFDFGGVIFDIDYNLTSKAFKALQVKNFDEMYSQKNANPLFRNLEQGKISEDEFYNQFRLTAKADVADEQIRVAWNAMLITFRKSALSFLKSAKAKYKLYLLSNTNIIHLTAFNKIYQTEIKENALSDYFDKIYFSHETGLRKPDKEAFECVLKENNLSADETLFIDDSIQNIEAAKAAGLQTVFLKNDMSIENLGL